MEGRILTVDDDDINLRLVSATLSRVGFEVHTALSGPEALDKVEEIDPDVILLDVMMPKMSGYEVCSRLRSIPATAHKPILILTALDSVEEKIKGFEAGADDFLPKPFAPDELLARVRALKRRSAPTPVEMPSVHGKVISVFSLRGGVGVSTIAANLVAGLTQLWDKPAVLVDLALTSGQSALMFNLPFRNTWANLAQTPIDDIDEVLVNEILLAHSSGALILAASPRPEQNEYLTGEKVTHVLNILKEQYPYLILDLPHDFHEVTLAGLDLSDEILTVMAPELASVRAMVCALDVFKTLMYPQEMVRLLLNWTFQKHGLAKKDIESAIKKPVDLAISFDPEAVVRSINFGRPTIIPNPTSKLGSLFEDLSFLVSDDQQRRTRPKHPTASWKRVIKRMRSRQKKSR